MLELHGSLVVLSRREAVGGIAQSSTHTNALATNTILLLQSSPGAPRRMQECSEEHKANQGSLPPQQLTRSASDAHLVVGHAHHLLLGRREGSHNDEARCSRRRLCARADPLCHVRDGRVELDRSALVGPAIVLCSPSARCPPLQRFKVGAGGLSWDQFGPAAQHPSRPRPPLPSSVITKGGIGPGDGLSQRHPAARYDCGKASRLARIKGRKGQWQGARAM